MAAPTKELLLMEAARSLKISRDRAYRLLSASRLDGRRGPRGEWLVDARSVERVRRELASEGAGGDAK